MNVRFIYRTHYQAIGVRLIDLVIKLLSPTEPANPKAAAQRVSLAAADVGIKFNAPAAVYLLGEMRELGILNRDNAICDVGVPYHILIKQQAITERATRLLFYFCVLFNGDGAFLWSLLDILNRQRLTFGEMLYRDVFERLADKVLSFYADRSASAYDYAPIQQQRDELLRRPLAPKTRKHKMAFHLAALEDLHLINVDNDTYSVTSSGQGVLARCRSLGDFEQLAATDRGIVDLGAELYAICPAQDDSLPIISTYRMFSNAGLKLVTVEQLAWALTLQANAIVAPNNLIELLRHLRDSHPGAVHLLSYRTRAIDSVQIDTSSFQDAAR